MSIGNVSALKGKNVFINFAECNAARCGPVFGKIRIRNRNLFVISLKPPFFSLELSEIETLQI